MNACILKKRFPKTASARMHVGALCLFLLPAVGAAQVAATQAATTPTEVRFQEVRSGYIGVESLVDQLCTGIECGERRIIYRLTNPQITTASGSRRFRFDVEVKLPPSEPQPVSFGATGISIRYNTDAFGSETFDECTTTDLGMTPRPRYIRVINNSRVNVTTWSWGNHAEFTTATETVSADMPYGKIAPEYRGLVRIECDVVDATQPAGVGMDPLSWNQFQKYTDDKHYRQYAAYVENSLVNVALDGSPYVRSVDVDSAHRKVIATLNEAVGQVSVSGFTLKTAAGGAAPGVTLTGATNAAQAGAIVFTLSAAPSTDVVITRSGAVTGQRSGLPMAAVEVATVPAYNAGVPRVVTASFTGNNRVVLQFSETLDDTVSTDDFVLEVLNQDTIRGVSVASVAHDGNTVTLTVAATGTLVQGGVARSANGAEKLRIRLARNYVADVRDLTGTAAATHQSATDALPFSADAAAAPVADTTAPRFVGLGYADGQSRLWLAFDEPVRIRTAAGARTLPDGAALYGFEVIPNYTGGAGDGAIRVLRARYRGGGVALDLARGIVAADVSLWVRYTPPATGRAGIYDAADPPNRIATVRTFLLPRSMVSDYDNDGIPDAMEARLYGDPLSANNAAARDVPRIALLRAGVAGAPAAVAYSGIRADGAAAHLGVATSATDLAAYYLSDTFGYGGGYAPGVEGYGCTGRFPVNYASPVSRGGCAVVDFNNIRAGVEHRIGWLAAAPLSGYWAVAADTASRLPEQIILRVPEFNMKRAHRFLARSAAADATVSVGARHDGPVSSQPLTVAFSGVAAGKRPSATAPDGFDVTVAGAASGVVSYALTGVRAGGAGKLWRAGDALSSLTPDKYSLGKITQTRVTRLDDDNLPPLFGRATLYAGSTAGANERYAVAVRGTESYTALVPVAHGRADTVAAAEVVAWNGRSANQPPAAGQAIAVVSAASALADGGLIRIVFTASNPPATVRNSVSFKVSASSAGAGTATTVLTWPVTDSADALASASGDSDRDGIPDARDHYRALGRPPVSVASGATGYPDRSSAGADSWHHIQPVLPVHSAFAGGFALHGGLLFHTGFSGDARILAHPFSAPSRQPPLAGSHQAGVAVQANYSDFSASLARDEFDAMVRQRRQDIAVVHNFRVHGVDPSVTQGALAGGRAGVVIPLPQSLYHHRIVFPMHFTGGGWTWLNAAADESVAVGFAPLQNGACPDDSGTADSRYRDTLGRLQSLKQSGDACMVVYLSDGGAVDRDGEVNGAVEALIGLSVISFWF
ncbi:MAG: hypothetical protein OXU34_06670 [Gammaproteobacteria bacterium]|nr:hypothetical protein [Gammaproteobacteria bacterium]